MNDGSSPGNKPKVGLCFGHEAFGYLCGRIRSMNGSKSAMVKERFKTAGSLHQIGESLILILVVVRDPGSFSAVDS